MKGVRIGLVACAFALTSAVATMRVASKPAPTPMPSARACSYFQDLYPATTQAFDKHHLTATQRSFVLANVRKIPASERGYARWMRDDEGLLIFDATPIFPDDKIGSHASWVAINTNVGIDPIECRMFVTPVADGGRSRTRAAEYR